jgi:hypothetical protein
MQNKTQEKHEDRKQEEGKLKKKYKINTNNLRDGKEKELKKKRRHNKEGKR